MCFHSCSCVEPSDPTNGTLKYWEINNITATEIYWEALEVKVLLKPTWYKNKQKTMENKTTNNQTEKNNSKNLSVMEVLNAHRSRNYQVTQRQTEKNTFRFFSLKVAFSPDGGSCIDEIKDMWAGLYWITHHK